MKCKYLFQNIYEIKQLETITGDKTLKHDYNQVSLKIITQTKQCKQLETIKRSPALGPPQPPRLSSGTARSLPPTPPAGPHTGN